MITKNFKLLINKKIKNNSDYYAFKGIDGSTAGGTSASSVFSNNNYNRVVLGSGNTQPSVEDYKLENKISGLTLIARSMVQDAPTYDNLAQIIKYTATYENSTNDTVTINEVGVEVGEGYSGSGWSGQILLSRDVLDSPLTMNPGDIYTFTVTIGG